MKKIVGFVLFAFGIAILLADFHVAYINQSAAHGLNTLAGLAILFSGMLALVPTFAREVADELERRAPRVLGFWPGGRRVQDPPQVIGVTPPQAMPPKVD